MITEFRRFWPAASRSSGKSGLIHVGQPSTAGINNCISTGDLRDRPRCGKATRFLLWQFAYLFDEIHVATAWILSVLVRNFGLKTDRPSRFPTGQIRLACRSTGSTDATRYLLSKSAFSGGEVDLAVPAHELVQEIDNHFVEAFLGRPVSGRQAVVGWPAHPFRAARDVDVLENVLRKWVRDFASDPVQAFPGHGQMKPEQLEIERLARNVTRSCGG
jgi:hypothetical protein